MRTTQLPDDAKIVASRVEWRSPKYGARERKQWGSGPWEHEPDHVQFKAHGFACMLHRNPMGAWCGYVGVPASHPYYEKDWDQVPDIDVHGGLTYAGKCQGELCHVPEPGEPDDIWWLGFDCSHCYDETPALSSRLKRFQAASDLVFGIYRDEAYVTDETTRLAQQLRARVS